MVWLFVPALEDSNSDSASPSLNTDVSVTWRGKPMPPESLSRAWKTKRWIRRLSGMILKPSMANRGVESWISSLRVSPASLGVMQESVTASRMIDGSGKTSPESLAKYDPATCSWRTFQVSLEGDLVPYSDPFPYSGSMRSGAFSPRQPPELPTCENDCSYWPTPTVMDPSYSPDQFKERMKKLGGNRRGVYLSDAVRYWPTPMASDAKGVRYQRDRGDKNGTSRPSLAMAVRLWPTPTARDCYERGFTAEGKRNSPALNRAVMKSPDGGRLNPRWEEWLMGWPIGWTKLERLEMESFQQWQEGQLTTAK